MAIVEGGTVRDLAQAEVLITFEFKPRGTGKTIEQILSERDIKDELLRTLCQEEADRMVQVRFLHVEKSGKYVFSKDLQGNYSWQPATRMDIIRYHSRRFLN